MKDDSVRSIERAFFILKCFNLDTARLTLTQIAEQINLPTTTTLRILATLVAVGLLTKTDGRYYKLGRESFLIGAIARAHFRPQHVAYPYMVEIRDDTNEATSLYGIDGECRVCYEHVPSLLSMRCVVRVGDCFPLWAGALRMCAHRSFSCRRASIWPLCWCPAPSFTSVKRKKRISSEE